MRRQRPLSYTVGPFTVRRDPAGERLWRVFTRTGVVRELFNAKTLQSAFEWAAQARAELDRLQDGGY